MRTKPTKPPRTPKLTAATIEGFVSMFLLKNFDGQKPIPEFHKELWTLCCDPHPKVAIAAPRGHGKSTAVTLSYVLANILFGIKSYIVIISATYGESVEFLRAIHDELDSNDEIEGVFGQIKWIKESEDDLILSIGGVEARVIGKGSGQKIRGRKWKNRRPDLIIGDDLEDDEQVENFDRREKFRNWVLNAVLPSGSDDCQFRIVGTILHFDSMLERLLNDNTWRSVRFKAHEAFDDFSNMLWPEKWTEEKLRDLRQSYINQGNPEGYSQEMLNYPVVAENAYFRRDDMLPMLPGDSEQEMRYYSAADLAISQKARGNYSVITTVGVDSMGFVNVVDVRRGRWDSHEIIAQMMDVHRAYEPELFGIERTHVWQTIGPFLNTEMRRKGEFLSIMELVPVGDKPSRARSFQAMMRSQTVKFDKGASWFPALEDEMSKFTNNGAKSGYDDQVDTLAYIGLMIESVDRPQTLDELDEMEYRAHHRSERRGRSRVTGY